MSKVTYADIEEAERLMREFEARVSELYNTHPDCLEARRHSFLLQKAVAWRLAMAELGVTFTTTHTPEGT